MRLACLSATLLLGLACLATSPAEAADDDDYVYGTGYGAADQAYGDGLRAAELDAYRKCAEQAQKLQFEESTIRDIGDRIIKNRIESKMMYIVQGARIIDEGRNSDGIFYAKVRLPIFGASASVAKAVFDPSDPKESFPQPESKVVEAPPAQPKPSTGNTDTYTRPTDLAVGTVQREGVYTGVIIDCRGLGLIKAMSPTIHAANGKPIYGYKNLDYDKVVRQGMAGYATSLTSNVSRAGSRPLVLKAIRVDNRVNPVLSVEDADKMLVEGQASGFLSQCAVVFVR